MSAFSAQKDFAHGRREVIGVLVANLGTPRAPEARALRVYLKEFLSDPRVVEVPRLLWWMILNLVILNIRPKRSAKAYAKVWTDEGSPLMVNSVAQANALSQALQERIASPVRVELAMRYGEPSIANAMERLREEGVTKLIVLPLYPQYSASTTASVCDAVFDTLKTWRVMPELRTISGYHSDPDFVAALAGSIKRYWSEHGRGDKLLMSFHGIPQRYFDNGDPYHCFCHATAFAVASSLGLGPDDWQLTFQSRFGREPWLKPYTDHTLESLGQAGTGRVDVVCPGFASDCIETLEEIDMENREIFLSAGGQDFHYIPCLNDDELHIHALAGLVTSRVRDWDESLAAQTDADRESARLRAVAMGADQRTAQPAAT